MCRSESIHAEKKQNVKHFFSIKIVIFKFLKGIAMSHFNKSESDIVFAQCD